MNAKTYSSVPDKPLLPVLVDYGRGFSLLLKFMCHVEYEVRSAEYTDSSTAESYGFLFIVGVL